MRSDSRCSASHHRLPTLLLAAAVTAACIPPVFAAEPIGDGVTPIYDEAYYATLDYYGNLEEGSVVKSYALNGAGVLTDYGTYDEVVNLTDGTVPTVADGETTFRFSGGDVPSHFYFEGKTTQPFRDLPWTLAMHYTLNGVPAKAEDLAGKTGVVEISVDVIPNEHASEYARYNYTLEAMALFNQDDILSLEAPGAQVQLIGNLRAVLFLALPGEEQHFTIRVGTEDFAFDGMTFLMVPATLSQLEEIAKLSERKDELEDDYHKLSGSLDDLLSAMGNMTGSLNAAAGGLDQLNEARGTFSAGKGTLYSSTDTLRGDLTNLADLLDPVAEQVQALSRTVTDSKTALNEMMDAAVSLKAQLQDMESALENLEDGSDDVERLVKSAADMKGSLRRLQSALKTISGGSSGGGDEEETASSQETVKQVKAVHSAYEETDLERFMIKMLLINGDADSNAAAEAMAGQLMQLVNIPAESAGSLPPAQQAYWQSAQQLKALHNLASSVSFQTFCENLPGISAAQAKQMNDLWIVYTSGQLEKAGSRTGSTDSVESALSAALLLNDPADTGDGTDSGTDGGTGSTAGSGDGAADTGSQPENADESSTVGGAAIDLITSGLDSTAASLSQLKSQLNTTLKSIASPTAAVVGDLADLCSQLDDVADLLDDADDLSAALRQSSKKMRDIVDDADDLRKTLNDYEPTLQESLKTVENLSTSAASAVRDTESLIAAAEDLLQRSGTQLDAGTQKTLDSLAAVLRRTADVMSASGSIQTSKDAISDIIEDTWNEHTGDLDNLLNMDATASAVSLTDQRNPSPQSVQVLIRSQEIKVEEPEDNTPAKQAADNGTFWSRVAQMFKDFWGSITGIFH